MPSEPSGPAPSSPTPGGRRPRLAATLVLGVVGLVLGLLVAATAAGFAAIAWLWRRPRGA